MRERKAFPGTLVPTPAGVGDCPAGCSSVCSTRLSPNPIHRRPLLGMTCRNGANMQRAKSSGTWLICMQNPFLEAVCQSPDHPSESICRSQSLYLFLSLSLPICLSLSLSVFLCCSELSFALYSGSSLLAYSDITGVSLCSGLLAVGLWRLDARLHVRTASG